ncbi:dynein regulatory complex subunit 2-like [Drosophila miranda]|uniref:dynein regulatory complex subunit 2-like n=1 Tax=Drosophila miranda TaxID=7229 RepID=UPI00143F808A|nr:dynein regulatory complex subunit 2-like [Drosophila miranda]
MGKKGKGKGNKLAKMSEEDRARYLQMRSDAEEETRRRKMQLIAMYMKSCSLSVERDQSLNPLNQEWRSILRQVKIQELQREIVDVEAVFKEALKRKDNVIQRLIAHIGSTEDMYANLQQSHMENISGIIGIHRSRLEFFRNIFEEDKQAVLGEWEQDSAGFREMHAQKQLELEAA